MSAQQFDSFEDLLKTFVPEHHMPEVWRVLYGGTPRWLLFEVFALYLVFIVFALGLKMLNIITLYYYMHLRNLHYKERIKKFNLMTLVDL